MIKLQQLTDLKLDYEMNKNELDKLKFHFLKSSETEEVKRFTGYLSYDFRPLKKVSLKHNLVSKKITNRDGEPVLNAEGKQIEIKANSCTIEESFTNYLGEDEYNKLGFGRFFEPRGEDSKGFYSFNGLLFNWFGSDALKLDMSGSLQSNNEKETLSLKISTYGLDNCLEFENFEKDADAQKAAKYQIQNKYEPSPWTWEDMLTLGDALQADTFEYFKEWLKDNFPKSGITKFKMNDALQGLISKYQKAIPEAKEVFNDEVPF
jgi:hypothetical protein